MAERAFNVVQLGYQASLGTAVPATTILPVEPGLIAELDRAAQSAREDVGRLGIHNPGRGYTGVRAAQVPLNGEITYEDFIRPVNLHAGLGTIAGPVDTTAYTHTFLWDETSDTSKLGTVELGTEATQDQWQLADAKVDSLQWGFDDLTVPGASPWKYQATALGKDRGVNALTGSLAVPSVLETAQGHLSTIFYGTTSTAFASLTEMANTLVGVQFTSSRNLKRRKYGGTTDTFDAWGFGDAMVEFVIKLRINSTTKTNLYDVFNVTGSLMTEFRFRVTATGSAVVGSASTVKSLVHDFRARLSNVVPTDRDGEDVYECTGYAVYDSTLGSRFKLVATNAIAALP